MSEHQQLAADFQFAGQDLPWLLERWATHRGEKVFLIWEPKSGCDQRWTYAEFWIEVRRVAAGLHKRGIVKGDRVLIHSDNCPEMVIAWFACTVVGALAITTNTASVADELMHAANVAGVRAAITQPRYAELVAASVAGLEWLVVTAENSVDDPERTTLPASVGESFSMLLGDPNNAPVRAREPLLPAGVVFTSGTTSRPKAVVHTHANWLWAGRMGSYILNFGPDDVHFAQLPFFHLNAQCWSTAIALATGGSVVMLPQPTVTRFWEVVVKHGITHMSLMPLVQKTLENEPFPHGHRLKVLQTGWRAENFAKRAGALPLAAYGMSELITYCLHSDLWCESPATAVGRPAAGYEMKLVNADSGAICGPNEDGELWVRGTRGVQIFLEYLNNPQANAEAFTDDGWFRTGDVLCIGDDGLFRYRDRGKDRIKVGGENISSAEVEAVVMQVPGVAMVAVVAQPHERLGEAAVAFVIRKPEAPDEAALIAAINESCETRLSRFKRPRAVYFMDEFPTGFMGKIRKVELRELAKTMPMLTHTMPTLASKTIT